MCQGRAGLGCRRAGSEAPPSHQSSESVLALSSRACADVTSRALGRCLLPQRILPLPPGQGAASSLWTPPHQLSRLAEASEEDLDRAGRNLRRRELGQGKGAPPAPSACLRPASLSPHAIHTMYPDGAQQQPCHPCSAAPTELVTPLLCV